MATYQMGYQNADAHGLPAFDSLDTYTAANLLAGAEPGLLPPVEVLLGDSLTLTQFQVVAINVATSKLVVATATGLADGTQVSPGVLVHGVTSGANNATVKGAYWRQGCFNVGPDSPLIWHASFDTEAKKIAAVLGSAHLVFRRRTAG